MTEDEKTTKDEGSFTGQITQIKLNPDGSWRLCVDCVPEDVPGKIESWGHEFVTVFATDMYENLPYSKAKKRKPRKEQEAMLRGWEEIAAFFQVPIKTIKRRRARMLKAGVIFFLTPEKSFLKKIVCSFPSLLIAYALERGEL